MGPNRNRRSTDAVDWRVLFRWVLVAFFLAAGANHFRAPDFYLLMMPPWLPWPLALVYVSGAAEMLGALGVLLPATRQLAGWGLIALLVAIFPANLHMAMSGVQPAGLHAPGWVLWARLPLQAAFIAWVWWTAAAPVREDPLD